MEKIFEKAHEEHLRAVYIYLNAADGKAYAKKGGLEPINKETLVNLFNLGVAVVVDTEKNEYYKAISLKVEEHQATLTYLTTEGAVTAKTVVSQEAE